MCLVGLCSPTGIHLDVGYRYGQGLIGAKVGRAGQLVGAELVARATTCCSTSALHEPAGPDWPRVGFYAGRLPGHRRGDLGADHGTSFPFHPLGIVLGTLYNDGSPYWAPFLFAWICQRLALRYGSLPATALVPVFLGLFSATC